MKETYDYHGRSIDLDLSDVLRACRWTYFIDGRYCVQGAADSRPIEEIRLSALALAHHSIDVLDSMHLANGIAGHGGRATRAATRRDVARVAVPDGASLGGLQASKRIA